MKTNNKILVTSDTVFKQVNQQGFAAVKVHKDGLNVDSGWLRIEIH